MLKVLFKRVETWVSSIEDAHVDSLSFIVDEWNQCSNLIDLKSFGEQEKELDNAFNQIVELRAVVAENEALVSSLQAEALASSDRYSQLETSLGNAHEGNNNLQNLVSELETTKQQLQQQLEQKCNLMEELLAADEALQKELTLTKSYTMSLEENFNTQTQELRGLKMQVAALEELAERKANLESINKNLEAELNLVKYNFFVKFYFTYLCLFWTKLILVLICRPKRKRQSSV
jgi:chromosome segregation ATPase